jgi:predicted RecB family nuclease
VAERLLTPSKITAWLDCAHFLTLQHEVDDGTRAVEFHPFGDMAKLLADKGVEHERAVLERYRAGGSSVFEVPERRIDQHESFADWVERVGNPLADGHDVVFQMPFVHDGIRGIADFVVKVVDEITGAITYEPVDAKLARDAAKPGHVLQLCFYAEAIAALTGSWPQHMRIALGSGAVETIRVADVIAYWRRLRGQLARLVDAPPEYDTSPEPCDQCPFCPFESVCEAQWRSADSLVHVAGMRRADRDALVTGRINTIARLATLDHDVAGLDAARRVRLTRQAALQVRARNAPDRPPPFELLPEPVAGSSASSGSGWSPDPSAPGSVVADAPSEAAGFAALPLPDDGDVFLDFEGHPFWKADAGLFFLFGWIERDAQGEWGFRAMWAHDRPEEGAATKQLVEYLAARRLTFPNMHVYHYNHTERSSLERMTSHHGVAELELERLIATGMFVDLLPVITGAMQVGAEGYGLKHMERLAAYERGHDIDRGAGAVVEYEKWTADGVADHLDRIAAYNEDDVRATRALRDWLVEQRPDGTPWRPSVLDAYVADAELDERVERLHAFAPGSVEHLMGDLLGYWRREKAAVAADAQRLSVASEADQMESLSAIAQLEYIGQEPQYSERTHKELTWPVAVFTFPEQPIDSDIDVGSKLIVALSEQRWAFFQVAKIDRANRELRVVWNQEHQDRRTIPTALVHYVWFAEAAKLDALKALADEMLTGEMLTDEMLTDDTSGGLDRVGHSMLRRDVPRFVAGAGPVGGEFSGDLADICGWVTALDSSCVPIQGPPGTGKTFIGAQIIHTLVRAGMRVGVTAMSHHAIDNMMQAVVERFERDGERDSLRAVRKAKHGPVKGVSYFDDNKRVAEGEFNVVAGTPWLFASSLMRDHPVDVLVVDEAGQLGLADTMAASISATNLILLGDPQQLPQVSQASHPNGAGASGLEHLLDGDRTVAADRGVLLDVTWRMHPDVCSFISDLSYEGKLHSHPSCDAQSTIAGTGLRWIRTEHSGRSSESPEEAELVVSTIRGLLGSDWTDQHGVTLSLTAADFMVVTPYNDQRRRIEALLAVDKKTRRIEVGTVDKFQGREAAVVVFSMATSSAEYMPRTADFLFSRNRLNVAISRARCLAYLICTDELLDARARTVEEMGLIAALCSFVEQASPA